MASATQPSRAVKIDVISDFLCPWCYIAHIDLERALTQAREAGLNLDFQVQYHPYILSSTLTCTEPKTKDEFYYKKMGAVKYLQMKEMVIERGNKEGIKFSFNGYTRQTMRAHRLMQKAYLVRGQEAQLQVLEALFRAMFEEEQDIGAPEVLAPIAVSAGIFANEEEAHQWVDGTELYEEVKARSANVQQKGITGVPFTVIDRKWALNGCQAPEVYLKIFEKLAANNSPPMTPQQQLKRPPSQANVNATAATA